MAWSAAVCALCVRSATLLRGCIHWLRLACVGVRPCSSHRVAMFCFPLSVSANANVAMANCFSSGAAHSESSDSSAGSTLPFSDGILSVPAWHVGEPEYDNYMTDLAAAPDILRRFAELDYNARLQIMRSTFNTKPQHPNAWMERCISRSFEDRDKRRSNPYRRGSTLGTSPVAGHADATPASQGSACSGNSPSKPGSNLFLRPDRSPRQTSSLATSPVQGPAQRALSSARSEVEPLEWICMLVVSWKIAALC